MRKSHLIACIYYDFHTKLSFLINFRIVFPLFLSVMPPGSVYKGVILTDFPSWESGDLQD